MVNARRILSFVLFVAAATCVEQPAPLSPGNYAAVPVALATGGITPTLLASGSNAVNLKIYTTASIAPEPNALILVAVLGRRSGTPLTPTVTGGGMATWTPVASVDYGTVTTPQSRLVVFRALSATPGSGPVTITYSSSISNATWIVAQWSGVDPSGVNGAGAIVQSGSSPTDAASVLSTTLGAFADPSDAALGLVGASLNGPAVTPGAGFTEIAEPTSGESTVLEAEWSANLNLIGASLTSAKNAAILGIELKASAGGGGGGGGGGGSTVSPTLSKVEPDLTTITAGSGTSTITVTVKDANDQPISGATVVLSATGAGNTLTQPADTTDANGVATGSFSSTIAGTKTLSATAAGTGIAQKPIVTVTPGPVSASRSTVTAAPGTIAPGTGTSTVTVTARDDNGNPISGAAVVLTGSSGSVTQPGGPTNASGVTTGTVSSAVEETITISAEIGGVPITQAATVRVVVPPVVDPLACTGYPEPRIFMESQAWWDSGGLAIPTNVGHHIHVGMCWPVNPDGSDALVDGILHLDVRILLHSQIGRTNYLRFQDASGSLSLKIPLVIGPADTTVWVPVDLDLSLWGTGRREAHITANIQSNVDGKRQFNSTGWQLCVRACTPTYRKGPWTEARGWYEGHDYQNARFFSLLPVAPVSGLWTFNVRLVQAGPGGVFIDPNFHAGIEGTRLADGGFSGFLTVDTRSLTNGTHRLVLVASDGKSAGVQLITFVVAN